jgi:hypothetical protein
MMMLGRYSRHRDRSTGLPVLRACWWPVGREGRPWPASGSGGVAWPVAGLALTVMGDIHGPPLLLGFGLDALLLWRRPASSPGRPGLLHRCAGLGGTAWAMT